MKLTLYQVDAFASRLFHGNPAAIIPLDKWLPDELMQKIAMENNLSETAFFVDRGDQYELRWFTPAIEINLCGHATLAAAWVLFEKLGYKKDKIQFKTLSGLLTVTKNAGMLWLDFPSWKPERVEDYPKDLIRALGNPEITGVYKYRDYLVELMNEDAVKKSSPDFTLLKSTGVKLIITAPGREVDFVSRFFAPAIGVDEDPVTGSAHSQLIPFWSEKLGKTVMQACQLSERGGEISCEQVGDRVRMGGSCVFYMMGEIELPDDDIVSN
jgi:PhzF family phenazine biosynthesis protein